MPRRSKIGPPRAPGTVDIPPCDTCASNQLKMRTVELGRRLARVADTLIQTTSTDAALVAIVGVISTLASDARTLARDVIDLRRAGGCPELPDALTAIVDSGPGCTAHMCSEDCLCASASTHPTTAPKQR